MFYSQDCIFFFSFSFCATQSEMTGCVCAQLRIAYNSPPSWREMSPGRFGTVQ